MLEVYRGYIGAMGISQYERSLSNAKADIAAHFQDNPDYHADAKRNGHRQPFILTRGGEKFTYNMICFPGDQLFTGDIIDAFGEKWIVTEARADGTLQKTGIMQQCNHKFRFQNFTPEIIERWGYIDQSGYSSYVTGTNQMQKSEEQFSIYLPYDEETAKIHVDKRLASHVGYDQFGHRILVAFKVTSCSPNTFSFSKGDHLLNIKAIRDVFSGATDNLNELICDYISPGETPTPPMGNLLPCEIAGVPTIMLGRGRMYAAKFYDASGEDVSSSVRAVWNLPTVTGISFSQNGNMLRISAEMRDDLIGTEFSIGLCDQGGRYSPVSMTVEVGNIA